MAEGFGPEVVEAARKEVLEVEEVNPEAISDVDISDISGTESESENEDNPLEENENGDRRAWREMLRNVDLEDFTGTFGPTRTLNATAEEIDFFNLMFPVQLYELIATETNRYATQEQEKNGVDRRWEKKETTQEEIRAYIAIQIVMGIVVAPDQDMYFTKDDLFRSTGINDRMTRDRLDKLNQYFHVADTTQNPPRRQPGHDKLAHVRPIMDILLKQMKQQYAPHKETSVDEAMVAYTGRLSFKQYNPMKPTKRGIKVWMRADPNNGYVNEYQVYTGKEGNVVEKGLGERVVKDLTRSIWGKYHHIYCDSYFTSVDLFQELLDNKTYACGTIRTNRKGLPPAISKCKLKRQGQMVQRQNDAMVATAWHDKRTVTLLSTNSNPLEITEVQKKQKNGTINVACPKVLKLYRQNMNGVDRANQLRSTYSIGRKGVQWWKYLFWFMVDVAICNAFILMKESPNHIIKTKSARQRERNQLEFRKKLAHQLIGDFWGKTKQKSVGEHQTRGLLHWPAEMDKRGTCKHCSKNEIESEIICGCEQCGVNLCVACFKPYHKEKHPELFN